MVCIEIEGISKNPIRHSERSEESPIRSTEKGILRWYLPQNDDF